MSGQLVRRAQGHRLAVWCPGCGESHVIGVGAGGWTWDGNEEAPTINPSILVTSVQWYPGDHFYNPCHANVKPTKQTTCHSFIRNGVWEFLGDCTHSLAGQQVPMVPWPAGSDDDL